MQQIEIDGRQYRTGRLDGFEQFHVVRKLMPLLSGMGKSVNAEEIGSDDFWTSMTPIAEAIANMSQADSEFVLKTCLRTCQMQNDVGAWVNITTPTGQLMFEHISLPVMLQLCWSVLTDNLGSFFPGPRPNGSAAGVMVSPPSNLPQ